MLSYQQSIRNNFLQLNQNKNPMAKKTKVYALFIGINQYRWDINLSKIGGKKLYFPPLSGCVSDANAMQATLKKDVTIELIPLALLDQEATKESIVTTIGTHLSNASAEDTVLIYYSGHGTMEEADTSIWFSESDKRLEGIVCYYNSPDTNQFILVDKEIRYLLHQLWLKTKAHIVTIFDCCHSGDNTRSVTQHLSGNTQPIATVKKIDFVFQQRPYESFLFANTISKEEFLGKGIEAVLPSAPHIQLAAAESNEPALEVNGHGVFTNAILQSLEESTYFLSYEDLQSRIRTRLQYTYEQRPKLYTPANCVALKQVGFLNKPLDDSTQIATITYNPSQKCYFVDRGILHGLIKGESKVNIELSPSQTIIGKVNNTFLDKSEVLFNSTEMKVLNAKDNKATISNFKARPIKVYLAALSADESLIKNILDALTTKEMDSIVHLTNHEQEADYTFRLLDNKLYLCLPKDAARPLLQPIVVGTDNHNLNYQIRRLFKQISAWKYLLELKNEESDVLPENNLEVQFYTVDKDEKLTLLNVSSNKEVAIQLFKGKGQYSWQNTLKIKVTNKSNQDLYVSANFHCIDFGIDPMDLITNMHFEPNESKWLRQDAAEFSAKIRMSLEKHLYFYNWESSIDALKFIYSTENFSNSSLKTKGLNLPDIPNGTTRGVEMGVSSKLDWEPISGWNSVNFKLKLLNPMYNQVKPEDIKLMLEDEKITRFAQALYLPLDNPFTGHSLTSTKESVVSKNIIADFALGTINKWNNYWRNQYYKEMKEIYPNRPRIVSEGDSWFQHPLLNDIIDNISKYYPTHCLAAAGDTIANYLKEAEFSKVIEDEKPTYFLLSGGGNDIVGEEMRGFLVRGFLDAPDGTQTERFFNQSYNAAVENLMELYKTVFVILQAQNPQLKIIVHGYDYLVPVHPYSNKTNWIGKYLDEFNITRPLDRVAVARYMIDGFNEGLKTLVEKHPQVRYINLRATVPIDEWDDEIHPNDTGFQKVSLKFLQLLAEWA
jgi:lysophospholipase L1-like esterase/uncharacterized caspase-like protein